MSIATAHSEMARSVRHSPRARQRFPRYPLYGAIVFVAFSIGAMLFGQSTGIGTVLVDNGSPVAIRDIAIDQSDGDIVRVLDAGSGHEIASFSADEGGFVRGSLRALNRMRQVAGIPLTEPYRVIEWEDGSVSLSDSATGERFYLRAFGKDNAEAFASFLEGHGYRGE